MYDGVRVFLSSAQIINPVVLQGVLNHTSSYIDRPASCLFPTWANLSWVWLTETVSSSYVQILLYMISACSQVIDWSSILTDQTTYVGVSWSLTVVWTPFCTVQIDRTDFMPLYCQIFLQISGMICLVIQQKIYRTGPKNRMMISGKWQNLHIPWISCFASGEAQSTQHMSNVNVVMDEKFFTAKAMAD